jgi:hypothetical protein
MNCPEITKWIKEFLKKMAENNAEIAYKRI